MIKQYKFCLEFIPVSFRAMQSQDYPVDFGDWMTDSSQYENTDAGRLIDEAPTIARAMGIEMPGTDGEPVMDLLAE